MQNVNNKCKIYAHKDHTDTLTQEVFLFDLRTKLTSVLYFNGDNASLKMFPQVVFQQWRK